MNGQSPTTPTTPDGQEKINKSQHQGQIVSDGTTDRVVLGFQKDGFGDGKDYGIKVSQEGFDVKTATEDELVMSSGFNMFKIVASGTATITVPNPPVAGSTYTATVTHNLGYVPAALAYVTPAYSSGNQWQLPHSAQGYNSSTGLWDFVYWIEYYLDSTSITFRFRATSYVLGAGNQIIRYYLLRETAN